MRLLVLVAVSVVVAVVLIVTAFGLLGSSQADITPVDLATPVDMAVGAPPHSAVVDLGRARIEVLGPTLLRLEYSPSGTFEDAPTVNAVNRRMPVPAYRTQLSGGWFTLRTSRVTLRYRVAGGPFTAADTSLSFVEGPRRATARPTWDWECPFDQTCQAGAASLQGGATLGWGQSGYLSSAGYVGGLLQRGAAATWTVLGAPAGRAVLSFRTSDVQGPGAHRPRTFSVVVDGHRRATLAAPATDGVDPWTAVSAVTTLKGGSDTVGVRCDAGDSCGLDVDSLSVGPAGAPAPVPLQTDPLGGWIRGFDTFTYGSLPTCAAGTAGATCADAIEPLHTDGLLDRAGWRLLDDSRSALWTAQGWVTPRPAGGDVEDGYLFAYGQDYAGALHALAQLTGASPLLPRDVFGVWYSDYTPYSSRYVMNALEPAFVRHDVPLDTLSLDTDWKAPGNWDGWEWNPSLFPHPAAFLRWARARGIDVTLNIHSSIATEDPEADEAQSVAGSSLAKASCMAGICLVWDWSSPPQAESNFALQQVFQSQGVSFFWLDWCCDASVVSMKGLTPDAWIGHLYAQDMVNQGARGFVLARIGSSNGNPQRVYPAGPWSDHTSAVAFTGDAWGTWATLAQEVALTPDEATIGEPYVSDDIGSYLGPPPQGTQDPADLFDRWVQFGTFQPILRLHSNDEQRLPWQYPAPVSTITEAFLRLREALVPYTYTLAADAHADGLPMARPLYLDDPGQPAAYTHPGEYLYGPDVLVAPVTTPGADATTTVWVPPGRWVDWFTGATVTGPATVTLSEPLSRMPVFVRAGGIVPEQPVSATGSAATPSDGPLVLQVFPGADGTFTLYADSGSGLGYTRGQDATTTISDAVVDGVDGASAVRVTVGAAHGHYPGAPSARRCRVDLVDVSAPARVTVDGQRLDERPPGSDASGWSYDAGTDTVVVTTPVEPTAHAFTVVADGAVAVRRTEPSPSS